MEAGITMGKLWNAMKYPVPQLNCASACMYDLFILFIFIYN